MTPPRASFSTTCATGRATGKSRSGRWIVLLATLLLTACPPANQIRPEPGPRLSDPDELLEAMHAARTTSLRAAGTVDMRKGGKRVKAHMIYLAKDPAWLRFETESFFEQPLSILVSDGMRFSAWDMKAGRFVRGSATPANISQIIPVPMDGPEVAGILLGRAPLIPYARAALSWDEEGGFYVLELSNSQLVQRIRVHPDTFRPSQVIVDRSGQRVYTLAYDDWLIRQGKPVIAKRISFSMPSEEIRLRIRIREAEHTPPLDEGLFQLAPPEGIQIENWR